MRLAKFKHANLGVDIIVDLDLLVFWYRSPGSVATHLVATGGAVLPVVESPEEVSKQKQGETTHVRSKRKRSNADV